MRSTGSSPGGEDGGPPVLVRYRLTGGPVGVDQRLTVFDDGAVELDERHRSRDPTWLLLDEAELNSLSLDGFEASGTQHFELKRGRRAIAGERTRFARARGWAPWSGPRDSEVAGVLTMLDPLRVRAVRLHPR